jgi:hypothetical protein
MLGKVKRSVQKEICAGREGQATKIKEQIIARGLQKRCYFIEIWRIEVSIAVFFFYQSAFGMNVAYICSVQTTAGFMG